ncbi:MAG: hypothetical protein RL091_3581 [Verrucomicrobiota bacterium]|jgi:uncharacterized protein (DUF2062 family)
MRDPLVALITQGITPDKVALTLGVGTACSLFPFLGLTSLLNLIVGLWLRLNQPLLQTLNQLLGAVQLLMILVYVRLGEWVWQAQGDRFTITEVLQVFRDASIGEFLQRFGWAGVHAFTAWALTAPLLIAAVTYGARPALRRLASKRLARP